MGVRFAEELEMGSFGFVRVQRKVAIEKVNQGIFRKLALSN